MEKKVQYDYLVKALKGADEVQARRFAAAMALGIGWGGISRIVELTGMSHSTIEKGIREIQEKERVEKPEKLRADGGGRKKVELKDQKIIDDLEIIMDQNTAGDPMSFLRWSSKSTRKISDELKSLGHDVGPNTVARLLKERDYSLQVNVKSFEGLSVDERDAQFRHINEEVKSFAMDGNPVISVDTKKKELVNQIGIPIRVCHYPPGTSKWNRIEHRMFSFISMNWKGKPLVNYETVVKLIGSTETKNGLKVAVREDKNKYPTGSKFSDEDLAKIHLEPDSLHPKWNYTLLPDGNIPGT